MRAWSTSSWATSSARRGERDEYGVRTMAWLSPADFDGSSTVSKQEVDAKLDEWETLGARVRKEARRLQREGD